MPRSSEASGSNLSRAIVFWPRDEGLPPIDCPRDSQVIYAERASTSREAVHLTPDRNATDDSRDSYPQCQSRLVEGLLDLERQLSCRSQYHRPRT